MREKEEIGVRVVTVSLQRKLGIPEELVLTRTPTHLRVDQRRESLLVGQMYIPNNSLEKVVEALRSQISHPVPPVV